ncbi:MFS transporter [Paratractidigestivibacter sp.]|uniref:MFS transporter n=1 Tax=Paratractidigestivibacter sp. TaxID=2847316 RepID=UPI002ABE624B|nr:MFS transporter [Paratractidigestivibacter sp.]
MNQVTKAKIGIFALTLLAMSTFGITPSIGLIMADLGAGASEVQQLTGIPNLMGIVSALIFSAVATKVPRKVMAIAAPVLIAVGGLLPVFVSGGMPLLLVCAGILGLGVGLVTNTANLLITDLIPADQQESMMAKNVIFVNFGCIVMTVGGGILSAGGWRNNYLIYLIAVPVLLLILMCIPWKTGEGQSAPAAAAAQAGPKPGVGTVAIVASACILAYQFVYCALPNNVSIILTETGIGDSTMAGMVTAAGTLAGIVCGATLNLLLKKIQKFSLAFGLIFMTLGMVIMGFASSLPMVIVAAVLVGFSLSIGFAQCPFIIAIGTNPAAIPTAMGLFSAGASIGGFVSPTILNMLSGAFMGGSAQGCCVIAGVIAAIAAAALLATRFQAGVIDRAFGGQAGSQAGAQAAGQVQGN